MPAASTASTVASPAASGIGGGWGNVEAVPGYSALKAIWGSSSAVSCASAGNCLLVGGYETATKRTEAFADLEVNGTWANSGEIPGYAALNANAPSGSYGGAVSASCPSAGNCAVAGYFSDKSGLAHGFVADLTGDKKWRVQELPYLATLNARHYLTISKISCASAGNCAVVGGYEAANGTVQPFVSLEYAGIWQDANSVLVSIAFNPGGNAVATAVSCPAVHHCVLGGRSRDVSGHTQSWIAYQSGTNSWGEFEPNGTAGVTSDTNTGVSGISCFSAGNCAVVGSYAASSAEVPYVINVYGGVWDSSAMAFSGVPAGHSAIVAGVSCPSAIECSVAGSYGGASGPIPFTVDEIRQSWGPATALPSYGVEAYPYTVSCGMPGDCAVGGIFEVKSGTTATLQPFVADELGYGWHGAGQIPGLAALNTRHVGVTESVSCSSPGNCAAVGYYAHGSTNVPFIAERKWTDPSTTAITLSKASVAYGQETTEKVTVSVTASVDVAPGIVTVKAGSTTLCTAWLRLVGSVDTIPCALTAKQLPVGKYTVTAYYQGYPGYGTSNSAKTLTITH